MAGEDDIKVEGLTQEEVFANDEDPAEAIAAIRRAEAGEGEEAKTGFSPEEVAAAEQEIILVDDEDDLTVAEKLATGEVNKDKESDDKKDKSDDTEDSTGTSENDKTDDKSGTDKSEDKITDDTDKIEDKDKEKEDEDKEDKNKEVDTDTDSKIKTFKANGKDFTFTEAEMMEQFEGVFGKAMDYTQKMQKIAPYRKMISALESENISQDQFNLALDILKGDKNALKQLAQDKKIDLSDLSFEDDETTYTPTDYGDTDFQSQVKDIESKIGNDAEYTTTVDIIDNQWDDASRKLIADNPNVIMGLHNDVKTGVYDKIAPEALKLKLQDGNSKSDLDYYLLAGQADKAARAATETENNQETVDKLNEKAQGADDKFNKESSEAEAKIAAGKTTAVAGEKGVIDYLDDDNDEKFDAWYKEKIGSAG